MSTSNTSHSAPVNLLALDGGGIRGLSELIILDAVMQRIKHDEKLADLPRPCDYFHLIGGTSTGGLIALMLGRLQMTTTEALEQYKLISERVFGAKNKKWKIQGGAFKATTLETEVQRVVHEKLKSDGKDRLFHAATEDGKCAAFVCAMPGINMRYPRHFRTHKVRTPDSPNCEIWEAARATTAAPTFFKEISIGEEGQTEERFIDAGIKCNNPVKQVMEEARLYFGDHRPVGVLVSIGTGHPGTIGLPSPDRFQKILPTQLIDVLVKIATSCETTADEMESQFKDHPEFYFRYSIAHGAGNVSLEEWEKMGDVKAHTIAYLQGPKIAESIDSLVMRLRDKSMNFSDRLLTLSAICGVKSSFQSRPYQSARPSITVDSFIFKPTLPPAPLLVVGRERETCHIIRTLLNVTPARVAILGGGGMGKTTLALSVLHENMVVDRYSTRYFVSCEAISSVPLLLGELANVLRIPQTQRDEHLFDMVISSFRQSLGMLCLDNFEAIWDDKVSRPDAEELLSHLDAIHGLAIIITMRGTQRPSGVSWSKPLLPALDPLELDKAKQMIEELYGPLDEFIEKLLTAVDGVPLAIKLIGTLLQEGNETSRSLWTRWEKTRTSVVEDGDKGRLSNLDTSIHLSVYSPRMQEDPNAIAILAMLSTIPDGLSNTDAVIDKLQQHIPEDVRLRESLLTLKRVSLVHVDPVSTPHRLRLLSPIRHFCQAKLKTIERLSRAMISFYIEMLSHNQDVTDRTCHETIRPELLNLYSILVQSYNTNTTDRALIYASIEYTQWALYVGNAVEDVLLLAIPNISEPSLRALCHWRLANVYSQCYKLNEAESSLKCAVELHRQAQDVRGEANDVQSLGDLYLLCSKLDEAESSLKCAVELHRQAQDVPGEAYDVQLLGDVYLRRDMPDEAESSFKCAVELHRQAHDVHGEAYDVQKLGALYLRRDKLDEAETSLKCAVELHRQAHSVLGEANDVHQLGDLYLRQSKLDEAESSLKCAVELHRQAHSVLGEANDVQKLGDLYLRRDKLDEAEASFKHAVELHRQAQDVLGEATDVQLRGSLYLRQHKLDEAKLSLKCAVELHRQAHSILGEANDVQLLGCLYLQQDKLDEAESSLKCAVELHRQAHITVGEAYDVQMLGDLYLRQDKLDQAESSLKCAVELHRQAQDVLGEATDVQLLGCLYLRQDKLDEAELSLQCAVELHRQAHSILGEANDVHHLGCLYLRQDKLDKAEASVQHAVELHRQARDVLGEATDVQLLGGLYLRQDKLDEAELSLKCAVELHCQAHSILGEANDVHQLGDLYLRQSKLDEAESSFKYAVELHRQAHSILGEANDLQKLGDLYLRRDKLDKAESSLKCAIELHHQAQDVFGNER